MSKPASASRRMRMHWFPDDPASCATCPKRIPSTIRLPASALLYLAAGAGYKRINSSFPIGNDRLIPAALNFLGTEKLLLYSSSVTLPFLSLSSSSKKRSASTFDLEITGGSLVEEDAGLPAPDPREATEERD